MNSTTVVIVTYNAMPWIDSCLQSVKSFNVVVVDNFSNDDTVSHILKFYPDVVVFPQTKNLGFGQGNNLGIRYALDSGAGSVFLLNQDAYVSEGSIEKLISLQASNPDYGILSPIHLNGNGAALDYMFSLYLQPNVNPSFYSDYVLGLTTNEIYKVPFVNAAAWLISRECIEKVGGFDPIFFHYGEDDNYCQRVLFHGLKIGVVRGTFIQHDREDRKNKVFSKGSNEDWLLKERKYKVNLANILEPDKMLIIQKKIQKKIIFSILKLNAKEAYYFFKELKLLKKIYPDILKSRIENVTVGNHYI